MSVRRRAIHERKLRDGMRRAEYEQTKRWMDNVRDLCQRKLLFVDSTISVEELTACFDEATTADQSESVTCKHGEAGSCFLCDEEDREHDAAMDASFSASEKRDATSAQLAEAQRFSHSAPAGCNHFPGQQDCEWCRATPSASEVPVEESAACEIERANRVYGRGAHTLMELMKAYERRVRSDCTSQADIDARPWECAEYRAAADYLRKTWPRAADPERVATTAQPVLHGAAAVTGLTQQDYDALVRDAMLWRTRSPTGAGGNVKAFVCCEGVGQHAPGCIAQESAP